MGAAPIIPNAAAVQDPMQEEESMNAPPVVDPQNFYRVMNQVIQTHYGENLPHSQQPLADGVERLMRPRMQLFRSEAANVAVASLELPGMSKSDVQITARNHQLIITGERRPIQFPDPDKPWKIEVNELKFGKFLRVIHLPLGTNVDTISASMDDGMLIITWPLIPMKDENEIDDSHSTVSHDS